MSVRRIFASSKVSSNSCKVAFSRGPLVYCAEGIDNSDDVLRLSVKKEAEVETCTSNKLNGIVEIKMDGYRTITGNSLYSLERPKTEACKLTLIPYYAWGNRGLNQMRVWLPEEE